MNFSYWFVLIKNGLFERKKLMNFDEVVNDIHDVNEYIFFWNNIDYLGEKFDEFWKLQVITVIRDANIYIKKEIYNKFKTIFIQGFMCVIFSISKLN